MTYGKLRGHENSRLDGSNPDPPYQWQPLGGCVWILTLSGLPTKGGSWMMPFILLSDQTSEAKRGVAVILSFTTRSFALICEGTPDAPPLSESPTNAQPHHLLPSPGGLNAV